MEFIDTHTHIYSKEFEHDAKQIIESSIKANISKLLMPCIDVDSIEPMLSLSNAYPNTCLPMIGIHPCHIDHDFQKKLYEVEHLLTKEKFIGIGEIGIDLYRSDKYKNLQQEAFHIQIALAIKHQLPIVIHCRNAMRETIEILQKYVDKGIKGIFHCFSGSLQEANQIIQLGFLLGIGGVVTFKNSHLQQVITHTNTDNIVLETDSPYLAPIPYRGKRNQPQYLIHIAEKIAQLKESPIEEIAQITSKNARTIFNIA
jgi:TatD DNase family protein